MNHSIVSMKIQIVVLLVNRGKTRHNTAFLKNCRNDLLSCGFNIDIGCVELRYADGSRNSIDCTAV